MKRFLSGAMLALLAAAMGYLAFIAISVTAIASGRSSGEMPLEFPMLIIGLLAMTGYFLARAAVREWTPLVRAFLGWIQPPSGEDPELQDSARARPVPGTASEDRSPTAEALAIAGELRGTILRLKESRRGRPGTDALERASSVVAERQPLPRESAAGYAGRLKAALERLRHEFGEDQAGQGSETIAEILSELDRLSPTAAREW